MVPHSRRGQRVVNIVNQFADVLGDVLTVVEI
jgi:hypothetical protein